VIIDSELGVIGVNGSVPGKAGSSIIIKDSIKLSLPGGVPFPAGLISNREEVVNE
jgi:large subunit ribosomal protein L3